MIRNGLAIALMLLVGLNAESSPFKHEGVLGAPVQDIRNLNMYAQAFIPYNPVIVEIGAFEGQGTAYLGSYFPYGKVFAFEANPRPFAVLQERMQSLGNVVVSNLAISNYNGSGILYIDPKSVEEDGYLLRRNAASTGPGLNIPVSCVVLDDWCKQNNINKIHFLRLDVGGREKEILASSPQILKTVLVLVTKTYFRKPTPETETYPYLKAYLEREGFELLSHWYQEGVGGEACFIRRHLFDSIWR